MLVYTFLQNQKLKPSEFFLFPLWYLRLYLHLKAVDCKPSRRRNVKVRQSAVQMCVCVRMSEREWGSAVGVCKCSACVHLDLPQTEQLYAKCSLWFEAETPVER